jgi:YVTN family beta-propeller protein
MKAGNPMTPTPQERPQPLSRRFLQSWLVIALMLSSAGVAIAAEPRVLEAKIPLRDVQRRIDHFAVDHGRQRLFVAELGNNAVGVVDLKARKTIRTIGGLSEPQGVAYVPSTDTLYVADARDGAVLLFRGDGLAPAGRIELGEDADNIRVDERQNRVIVGYGDGALAIIDPERRAKIADVRLKAHPESFQLDATGARAFVNVPDAREVAVVDLEAGIQSASWPTGDAQANFPMALDAGSRRILVAFRKPPRLAAFDEQDGKVVAQMDTCGDADDVFVDTKRHRVYVSCGEGAVDVLEQRERTYERVGRVPTASGARTSLLVPELDHLFVAARVAGSEPAAIWVFRPAP